MFVVEKRCCVSVVNKWHRCPGVQHTVAIRSRSSRPRGSTLLCRSKSERLTRTQGRRFEVTSSRKRYPNTTLFLLICAFIVTLFSVFLSAQEKQESPGALADPLVRFLVAKGVLSEEEAQSLPVDTYSERRLGLINLLVSKG